MLKKKHLTMDSVKCSTCEGSVPSRDTIFFYDRKTRERIYSCKKHHKCEKCSGALKGLIKTVGNAVFHLKCMECSKCKRTDFTPFTSIHMKSVRYEEGKLICGQCRCDICKKNFSENDNIVPFYSLRIHEKCVSSTKCCCGNPLDMQTLDDGMCMFCKKLKCAFCGGGFEDSESEICHSISLMKRAFYGHKACKENMKCQECKGTLMLCPSVLNLEWTPETEKQQPLPIRNALKVSDVIFKNYGVPKDIIHYIKKKIVDVKGWESQIPFLNKICVPGICRKRKDPNCSLCNVPLDMMNYENGCTTNKCVKYQFKCECGEKVGYNSDPLKNCTPYRCRQLKCELCKEELLYDETADHRKLCSWTNCLVYEKRCPAGCGDLIRKVPLDEYNECSNYRCKLEKCIYCKGQLAPTGLEYLKGCTKDSCKIYMGKCKWCSSLMRLKPQDKNKECSIYRCIKDKCKVCGDVYDFNMNLEEGCVPHTKSSSKPQCKKLRESFYSALEGFLGLLVKNEIAVAEILKNGSPESWFSLAGSTQIHLEALRKKNREDYTYAKSILEDIQNVSSILLK